jgi:hypothetical protein
MPKDKHTGMAMLVGLAFGGLFGNIAGNYFLGLIIGGVMGWAYGSMTESSNGDDDEDSHSSEAD